MSTNQQIRANETPRILLIEDADDLAQVVIRELEAAGYSVAHTTNGGVRPSD